MAKTTKAFPGIVEFGELFRNFMDSYMAAGNGFAPLDSLPPYLRELLGDRLIPSFVLHNADGTHTGWAKGKPFRLGLVADQMHITLRSLMINFRTSPDLLPASVQRLFSHSEVERDFVDYQRTLRQKVFTDKPSELSERLKDHTPSTTAVVLTEFLSIPDVTITLETREKQPKRVTVTMPNVIINLPDDKYRTRGGLPIPLAAVIWSLSRVRSHLVSDKYLMLTQLFVGVQTSITEHMKVVCDVIQQYLPAGFKVEQFLYLKEDDIRRTIKQEEHTLAIFDVFCQALVRPSRPKDILRLVYNNPWEATLKTEEFSARDCALMIYATTKYLHHISSRIPSSFPERTKNIYAPQKMGELADALLSLANDVAAITPPDWKQVSSYITTNTEAVRLLKEAWLKVNLSCELVQFTDMSPAAPMRLISELVPEIAQQHELETLKASHRPKSLLTLKYFMEEPPRFTMPRDAVLRNQVLQRHM